MGEPKEVPRLAMVTFGCRVNQAETGWMVQCAKSMGYHPAEAGEVAALVVINTCAVTGESERQARQMIRRVAREHPGARVVVTGCYAQRDPQGLAAMAGVDLVLGNGEKRQFETYLRGCEGVRVAAGDPGGGAVGEELLDWPAGRAFGILPIQNGCDERCTFCVIPGVRGGSRSVAPGQVLERARSWIQAGARELVLTGINLGSYGRDLTPALSLAALVRRVMELPGEWRLRLSSLDPADLDDDLVDCFGRHERLCHHVHLSVQSGDDGILARMHRRYRRAELVARVAALQQAVPGVLVGADVMVGFPSESDQAFEATREVVERCRMALLHVFRYSERPGTAAARFPRRLQVAAPVMKERAERLRRLGRQLLTERLIGEVGNSSWVVVESVTDGWCHGKSATFLPVRFPSDGHRHPGELVSVLITGWGVAEGLWGMALPSRYNNAQVPVLVGGSASPAVTEAHSMGIP